MGHPSKPCHTTGMPPHSPTGDKPENYEAYGTTDHENPPLLLKGWQDLFDIWNRTGSVITDKFTIKYGSGVSVHGYTYYRDKRLPPTFPIGGKEVAYDLFWFAHELTELGMAKWMGSLKDHLLVHAMDREDNNLHISNQNTVTYLVAHQQAETVENALVRASGIDLAEYVAVCDYYLKQLETLPLELSPVGLSLYPYKDAKDLDTLNEIVSTGGPVSAMMLPIGVEGGETDAPYNGD